MGVILFEFSFSSESGNDSEDSMCDVDMLDILNEERRYFYIIECNNVK